MFKLTKPRSTKGLAILLAKIAENKLADEVLILDLSKIETAPSEFFVICSCDSDIQARAVTDEVLNACRELDLSKPRIEGVDTGQWILVDSFDVIMHIMNKETRNYYKIEKLWGDGKFYKLDDDGKPKALKNTDED